MRVLFSICIVSVYVTINSHGDPTPVDMTIPLSEEEGEQRQFVVDLANNFSSNYIWELTPYYGMEPLSLSALTTFIPMSLLSYGTRGQSRKNYLRAIGLEENKTQTAELGYEKFLNQLIKYDINIKTKIFVRNGSRLNHYFENISSNAFYSDIETFEVIDGFMDVDPINSWIATQVDDKLGDPLAPHILGCDPSFVVINSMNLKRTWKVKFDVSRTNLRPFYTNFNNKIYNVSTMYTVGNFKYGRIEEVNATFIELPFESNSEDDAMSMFIIMSPAEERLTRYLRRMDLKKLLNSTEKRVEVYLPKFTMRSVKDSSQWIEALFKSVQAWNHTDDISGLFESPESPNLPEYSAKAIIEIDERGQQAVASSSESVHGQGVTHPSTLLARGYSNCVVTEPIHEPHTHRCRSMNKRNWDVFSFCAGISYQARRCNEDDYENLLLLEKCPYIASMQHRCDAKKHRSPNRKTRSVGLEAIEFRANRVFTAMIVTKGQILTDIFTVRMADGFYVSGQR